MITIGYTDQVNTCDCCGKNPLKHTVAIYDPETDEELYLGSVCAARYTGYRMTGNPWRAMERMRAHVREAELTLDEVREAIEDHQAEKLG